KRTETHNIYTGLGLNLNPLNKEDILNGYFFTIGVRWKPIPELRALGIIFELSPLFYESSDGMNLRSFLGVSYQFGK
ncbi:MAG: hypothetical protein ACPF9D_05330, partial [Owenweeksia sp.]